VVTTKDNAEELPSSSLMSPSRSATCLERAVLRILSNDPALGECQALQLG